MPAPTIANFDCQTPDGFLSKWGTPYAHYTAPAGTPQPVTPEGWQPVGYGVHLSDPQFVYYDIRKAKDTPAPPPPVVVVTPPVVVPPPIDIRPSTRLIANPAAKTRGQGLVLAGGRCEGYHVEGYGTNVVVDATEPVYIRGMKSLKAWRDEQPPHHPLKSEWGQGLMFYRGPSLTIEESFFGWNGWRAECPQSERQMFRHNVYAGDKSGDLVIRRCIGTAPCFANFQARGKSCLIEDCIADRGVVGFLMKTPNFIIRNSLILGWDFILQRDREGREVWTDGQGVAAWKRGTVENCLFVGLSPNGKGDNRKCNTPMPIMRAEGVKVDELGNRVVQWPGTGVSYAPDYLDILANRLSVPDAIARIRADIARLI